jgi:glucose/mannose transport system substrate-binding protein
VLNETVALKLRNRLLTLVRRTRPVGRAFGTALVMLAMLAMLVATLWASDALPIDAALPIEVIHFWTSDSEAAALRVLAAAVARHGGRWIDSPIVGSDAATSVALTRINGGDPPAAMLWVLGNRVSALAEADLLNDMDAPAARGHWRELLPPLVLEHSVWHGHLVAVPAEIHGENWLWFNVRVFHDAGLEPPAHWSDFFAIADRLRARGIVPLALGGQDWQLVLLFNAVLLDVGGPALYRDFYIRHQARAATCAAMRDALLTFARLRAYVDPGSPGRSWNQSTALVITGRAAMQVMGDWAKREFTDAGLAVGTDFGCRLAPGSDAHYILAVDSFTFPRTSQAGARAAQQLLANAVMDPVTQLEFNRIKGSLPVRRDLSLTSPDACTRLALEAFADADHHLPNPALALDSSAEGAVGDVIARYWISPSMSAERAGELLAQAIKDP